MAKRILVLGATGRVGRVVIEDALRRGHHVTALVRAPEKLGHDSSVVRVVQGDALDAGAVGAAVTDQNAVLYVLGSRNVRHVTLFSESTRILLDEMKRHD